MCWTASWPGTMTSDRLIATTPAMTPVQNKEKIQFVKSTLKPQIIVKK